MESSRIYLIFPDRNDIFNYIRIICTRTELSSKLVDEELMIDGSDWRTMDWVVFEDGIMIE
jgi:hypothetical protein